MHAVNAVNNMQELYIDEPIFWVKAVSLFINLIILVKLQCNYRAQNCIVTDELGSVIVAANEQLYKHLHVVIVNQKQKHSKATLPSFRNVVVILSPPDELIQNSHQTWKFLDLYTPGWMSSL